MKSKSFSTDTWYPFLPSDILNIQKPCNCICLAGAGFPFVTFSDGNGRTSRLLMNYQLMSKGFVPISIAKENRLAYYETLDEYAVNKNLQPFADTIAELEEQQLDRYIAMMQWHLYYSAKTTTTFQNSGRSFLITRNLRVLSEICIVSKKGRGICRCLLWMIWSIGLQKNTRFSCMTIKDFP